MRQTLGFSDSDTSSDLSANSPAIATPGFSTMPERYNVGTLLDANLDAGRGDKVAIVCGDDRVAYADLHARACAAGRALRA